jgi:hypothetical protein
MANEYCPSSSTVARHFGIRNRRRIVAVFAMHRTTMLSNSALLNQVGMDHRNTVFSAVLTSACVGFSFKIDMGCQGSPRHRVKKIAMAFSPALKR